MNTRIRAYAVGLVLVSLVASPLAGAFENDDSFPISTYPMFAAVRSTEASVPHVILVGENREEWPAPPSAVASGEVLQAQATLRQAMRHGEEATVAICERIARRIADSGAVSVQIVTSKFDAIRYFRGDREPISQTIVTTCGVRP